MKWRSRSVLARSGDFKRESANEETLAAAALLRFLVHPFLFLNSCR